MKRKFLKYSFPVVLLGIFAFTFYNSGKREKVLLQALSQSLTAGHFESHTLDKQMSERVYSLYIERLDYGKRFLLKEDVKKLEKFRYLLGEEIKQTKYDFFDLSVQIIEDRKKKQNLFTKMCLKIHLILKKMSFLRLILRNSNFQRMRKRGMLDGGNC